MPVFPDLLRIVLRTGLLIVSMIPIQTQSAGKRTVDGDNRPLDVLDVAVENTPHRDAAIDHDRGTLASAPAAAADVSTRRDNNLSTFLRDSVVKQTARILRVGAGVAPSLSDYGNGTSRSTGGPLLAGGRLILQVSSGVALAGSSTSPLPPSRALGGTPANHASPGLASALAWIVNLSAPFAIIEIIAVDVSQLPEPSAGTLVGGLIASAWCLGLSRRRASTIT